MEKPKKERALVAIMLTISSGNSLFLKPRGTLSLSNLIYENQNRFEDYSLPFVQHFLRQSVTKYFGNFEDFAKN